MSAKSKAKAHPDTPLLEWIFGALGAALFVLGVGFLIAEGLRGEDTPGRIEFQVEDVLPANDGFFVRYRARNHGTLTLAELQLRADLRRDDTIVESARGTLDFLPGQSSRTGGFYFREDPRALRLEINVEGFQDP